MISMLEFGLWSLGKGRGQRIANQETDRRSSGMKLTVSILISVFAMTFAASSFAEEPGHACPHACKPGAFEMTHATGTLYCVGCALKSEFGAKVDCGKSGHLMAIKVTKCEDYCGDEKAALVGATLMYLPTEATKAIDGYKHYGATVTLSGRYYFATGVIEPEEVKFAAEEGKKG